MVAADHTRHDEACHRQQTLDVRVDHLVPVVEIALVFWFETTGESRVVDEDVDSLPFGWHTLDGTARSLTVADVEGEGEDVRSLRF